MNVYHRGEPIVTNTIYCYTHYIDDGSTCTQLFVGRKSLVLDVYGTKTDNQFLKKFGG